MFLRDNEKMMVLFKILIGLIFLGGPTITSIFITRDSIKNPKDSRDWQAIYPEGDLDEKIEADPIDAADKIEDYQERYDLNDVLEKRLNSVKDALKSIANGTYGKCKVGGKEHDIEPERLEANPAATTCINHIE